MADFPGLLHSYYQAWFRFHPETAVDLGVRGFESQLTPFADDDIGALNTLNEKLIDSLDEIETSKLTAAQAVDREVMYGAAIIELSETIEHDWRYRDPARYLPVHAIYQLTLHKHPIFLQHALNSELEYVTPVENAASLGEHNFVSLRHTCVHEAWPGHHLQFVTANRGPRSSTLPRLVNPSSTLYEGWALYCEQLMQEQGFLDSPESRFILLKDRLWRALRIMLDMELHTRGLSVEQAAERMQHWLGFTHAQAMADLGWYTRSPTVPMGYATGWALINATRERLRQLEKPFHPKSFHDRLLSEGSIALSHVIREQFGHPVWDSVQRDVFARRESESAASV